MSKSKKETIDKGSQVTWKWGKGTASGKVIEKSAHKTTKNLKGSAITRKGTPSNPALSIKQAGGKKVLKLKSEVKPANK